MRFTAHQHEDVTACSFFVRKKDPDIRPGKFPSIVLDLNQGSQDRVIVQVFARDPGNKLSVPFGLQVREEQDWETSATPGDLETCDENRIPERSDRPDCLDQLGHYSSLRTL